MGAHRVHKNENYTIMSNYHLRDKNLSLKAKGLLSLMFSLPENWQYSVGGLVSLCKESETSVKSALNELKDNKYLIVTKLPPSKETNGRYEYMYDFYEYPQIQEGKKQEVENLPLENLPLEVLPLENTHLYKNTDISSTDNQIQTNKETENRDRKERKTTTFDAILDSVDYIREDEELREVYTEFIKMRQRMKKPLTDYALKMIINEAHKLADGDIETIKAIVNQSIMRSWQGVFPLKEVNQKFSDTKPNTNVNPYANENL